MKLHRLGMKWLHDRDIVHRDLKASNVLLSEDKDQSYCFVADYECSTCGLKAQGSRFWRAPEILRALQSKVEFEERKKLFTKASDVYSYGMTCYEILIGKIPFEDHKIYDYDVVLRGQTKLEVPNYVAKWLHELLDSCWRFDPKERPTFDKILEQFKKHGGSCSREDTTHSKYNWSQLMMTVRMSMLIEFQESSSAMDNTSSRFEPTQVISMEELDIHSTQVSSYERLVPDGTEVWSHEELHVKVNNMDVINNMKVFNCLQKDPTWGSFFRTFGHDTEVFLSSGLLEIGDKLVEGGQAEIYNVHVTWADEDTNKYDQENRREWVLKVYKLPSDELDNHWLDKHWSMGMLTYHAEKVKSIDAYCMKPRNVCDVFCGMLLEDGRYAYLMERHQGNLRQLIMFNMKLRSGYDYGPFSQEVAEGIIFEVATGMDWLHSYNIVHRDLKSLNVLVTEGRDGWYQCFVCDFECNDGVTGTGFWRAPEILQFVKDRTLMTVGASRDTLFSKAIDVYSFGMTCYEILTGKIPFEDERATNYEVVLSGGRLEVPKYVDDWMHKLLGLCWQVDPASRPSFKHILGLILANSTTARRLNEVKRQDHSWILSLTNENSTKYDSRRKFPRSDPR